MQEFHFFSAHVATSNTLHSNNIAVSPFSLLDSKIPPGDTLNNSNVIQVFINFHRCQVTSGDFLNLSGTVMFVLHGVTNKPSSESGLNSCRAVKIFLPSKFRFPSTKISLHYDYGPSAIFSFFDSKISAYFSLNRDGCRSQNHSSSTLDWIFDMCD